MEALVNFRQHRQVASLVRSCRRGAGFPLIVLPTTATSLQFAERLATRMPLAIIGNPRLLADWTPGLCALAKAPLAAWRELKVHERLPCAVISYPDQLIGADPSFHRVSAGDRDYSFSIVEMMLLMKFSPPVHLGRARFHGRGESARSTLDLRPGDVIVPAGLSSRHFDAQLLRLMAPVTECAREPHEGWRARDVFALKMDDNFEMMLKLRLLEIESLLRLGHRLAGAGKPDRELLAELQDIRRKPMRVAAAA